MENTRELLIDAAFSFYNEPVWDRISLSKIAGKVGISKPAIFKHFESKQELEDAMLERIRRDYSEGLAKIDFSSPTAKMTALREIINLISSHKEYLNYLICTRQHISLDDVTQRLREQNRIPQKTVIDSDGNINDIESYVNSIFIGSTILIGLGVSRVKGDGAADTEKIISLITNGLSKNKKWEYDSFRLAELDSICKKNMENIADVDKFTLAIANVIEKNGFQAVTVEAIANELGVVKSSLYSKFENKKDIFKTIMQDEKRVMAGLYLKNLQEAENNQEKIYVMMATMLFYFLKRRKIFVVLRWLQFSGEMNFFSKTSNAGSTHTKYNADEFFSAEDKFHVEKSDTRFLLGWASFAATFIAYHGSKHSWNDEIYLVALKKMYTMVLSGYSGKSK